MVPLIKNDTTETARQIRTAIFLLADLKREVVELEAQMSAELECSRVKDPKDVAYPLTLRAMKDRLKNLEATISYLERAAA